eukprot:TRINITY_DN9745_c0_g2_i6.p1 TRINITY_DN9745_c0_g2~~TRINITY_DN9745_c0_g2_i6.p1  ORF type:complete len:1023 (+),score=67.70 TRINITY_DN9745_c0_g2_i6:205-3273(+)
MQNVSPLEASMAREAYYDYLYNVAFEIHTTYYYFGPHEDLLDVYRQVDKWHRDRPDLLYLDVESLVNDQDAFEWATAHDAFNFSEMQRLAREFADQYPMISESFWLDARARSKSPVKADRGFHGSPTSSVNAGEASLINAATPSVEDDHVVCNDVHSGMDLDADSLPEPDWDGPSDQLTDGESSDVNAGPLYPSCGDASDDWHELRNVFASKIAEFKHGYPEGGMCQRCQSNNSAVYCTHCLCSLCTQCDLTVHSHADSTLASPSTHVRRAAIEGGPYLSLLETVHEGQVVDLRDACSELMLPYQHATRPIPIAARCANCGSTRWVLEAKQPLRTVRFINDHGVQTMHHCTATCQQCFNTVSTTNAMDVTGSSNVWPATLKRPKTYFDISVLTRLAAAARRPGVSMSALAEDISALSLETGGEKLNSEVLTTPLREFMRCDRVIKEAMGRYSTCPPCHRRPRVIHTDGNFKFASNSSGGRPYDGMGLCPDSETIKGLTEKCATMRLSKSAHADNHCPSKASLRLDDTNHHPSSFASIMISSCHHSIANAIIPCGNSEPMIAHAMALYHAEQRHQGQALVHSQDTACIMGPWAKRIANDRVVPGDNDTSWLADLKTRLHLVGKLHAKNHVQSCQGEYALDPRKVWIGTADGESTERVNAVIRPAVDMVRSMHGENGFAYLESLLLEDEARKVHNMPEVMLKRFQRAIGRIGDQVPEDILYTALLTDHVLVDASRPVIDGEIMPEWLVGYFARLVSVAIKRHSRHLRSLLPLGSDTPTPATEVHILLGSMVEKIDKPCIAVPACVAELVREMDRLQNSATQGSELEKSEVCLKYWYPHFVRKRATDLFTDIEAARDTLQSIDDRRLSLNRTARDDAYARVQQRHKELQQVACLFEPKLAVPDLQYYLGDATPSQRVVQTRCLEAIQDITMVWAELQRCSAFADSKIACFDANDWLSAELMDVAPVTRQRLRHQSKRFWARWKLDIEQVTQVVVTSPLPLQIKSWCLQNRAQLPGSIVSTLPVID